MMDMDEVVALMNRAAEIVEPHLGDPAAEVHVLGFEFAAMAAAWFENEMLVQSSIGRGEGRLAEEVRLHWLRCSQLAAHHLDMLDRLSGALAGA